MSLMRQLWLMIVLTTLVAFAGSLFISIWSARDYLSAQLERKNSDNASALALAMTQQEKDPVIVELQVAALFDTGYYQHVSVVDPLGKPIVERTQLKSDVAVPAWFVNLFPIRSVPGVAQVSDGWKQYGVVTVISHSGFAHQALWEQSAKFVLWFLLGGLAAGTLGMLGLRVIGRSLADVVRQAAAIGERRFIAIAEPRPAELKAVAQAMNAMVERVKTMFAEEAARLDGVRRKVNHDPVTGLASREYFMAHLGEIIRGEQFAAVGALVLVRVGDIAAANTRLGHQRVDKMLIELGKVLYDSGNGRVGQRAGRLNGSDFAVVCPAFASPREAALDIHERLLRDWVPNWSAEIPDLFHLAAVGYRRQQSIGELMAQIDEAIARALGTGPNGWYANESAPSRPAVSAEQWRSFLTDAVSRKQLTMALYPVRREDGATLHQEGVLRLRSAQDGSELCAGDFMPVAAQLNLTSPLDLGVVELAIAHLERAGGSVAVNLSAETIADFGFHRQLTQLLSGYPELRRAMLFEVPEYGVFRHFDAFRELAALLKKLGCRVGIEYFGQRFAEADKLASLGLDYIKVHPSYLQDIANNAGNQEFLRGLCHMAHAVGIEVIATGVARADDLELLTGLGFDGATGPGIA